jgi:hypothetical protein
MGSLARRIPLLLGGLCAAACTNFTAPVMPAPTAGVFANFKAPLTTDFDETPIGTRRGSATTYYVYEPFFTDFDIGWGDASIATAARRGGVSKVYYADYEYFSILGIYTSVTVHAHGD